MSAQFSVTVRNAQGDAIETAISTAPKFRFRTGAAPANCAAADTGTELALMDLPSDWMAAASSGSKSKSGTWQDAAANNNGTIGHFRIYDSAGTTCHIQGSVTATGGGGDCEVDNTSVTVGQVVTVTAFTINIGNA